MESGYENSTLSQEDREYLDYVWNNIGWGANVDWRNHKNEIKWSKFLFDSRYQSENIGIYEGCFLYGFGAYRPTENSMMRYNDAPFNAPSREEIYKRMMKISEGENWVYDYEDFVSFDQPSRNYSTSNLLTRSGNNNPKDWEKRHMAPIYKKGTWRDATSSLKYRKKVSK